MNDGVTRTYDPKLIIVTLGGIMFTGFASGTFLDIDKEDGFKEDVGADGTENRTNTNKTGALATVTLQQQSITNDQLTALYNEDIMLNTGKRPFTVKDGNGTTFVYSKNAYIMKLPKISEGDSAGSREWKIRLPNVTTLVGGNIV